MIPAGAGVDQMLIGDQEPEGDYDAVIYGKDKEPA